MIGKGGGAAEGYLPPAGARPGGDMQHHAGLAGLPLPCPRCVSSHVQAKPGTSKIDPAKMQRGNRKLIELCCRYHRYR